MKNIVLTYFISLVLLISSFTVLDKQDYKVKTVVIDAGHGGKDPGCHGAVCKEANIALQTALELGRLITENCEGVKVIYTRKTDTFLELHDRAGIANKNHADLFISIHCNSGPSAVHGTETYTMGLHTSEGNLDVAKRENSVIFQEENYEQNYEGMDVNSPMAHILMANWQQAYLANSLKLAGKIENQFKTRVGRNSRGVKQAGFLVLWKSAMPSILIEIGYLTNPTEEKFLNNSTNRVYIASAVYRAFKEYKEELESMN